MNLPQRTAVGNDVFDSEIRFPLYLLTAVYVQLGCSAVWRLVGKNSSTYQRFLSLLITGSLTRLLTMVLASSHWEGGISRWMHPTYLLFLDDLGSHLFHKAYLLPPSCWIADPGYEVRTAAVDKWLETVYSIKVFLLLFTFSKTGIVVSRGFATIASCILYLVAMVTTLSSICHRRNGWRVMTEDADDESGRLSLLAKIVVIPLCLLCFLGSVDLSLEQLANVIYPVFGDEAILKGLSCFMEAMPALMLFTVPWFIEMDRKMIAGMIGLVVKSTTAIVGFLKDLAQPPRHPRPASTVLHYPQRSSTAPAYQPIYDDDYDDGYYIGNYGYYVEDYHNYYNDYDYGNHYRRDPVDRYQADRDDSPYVSNLQNSTYRIPYSRSVYQQNGSAVGDVRSTVGTAERNAGNFGGQSSSAADRNPPRVDRTRQQQQPAGQSGRHRPDDGGRPGRRRRQRRSRNAARGSSIRRPVPYYVDGIPLVHPSSVPGLRLKRERLECVVCLDRYQTSGYLHDLRVCKCVCRKCARQIYLSGSDCPICRERIDAIVENI